MPLQTIKQSDSAYYGNIRPSQRCVTNPISSGRELHLCVRSKCLLPSSLNTDGHSSRVSAAGLIFNILAVRKRAVIRRITIAGRVASLRRRGSTGVGGNGHVACSSTRFGTGCCQRPPPREEGLGGRHSSCARPTFRSRPQVRGSPKCWWKEKSPPY